jgi:hypothetical protein
MAVVVAVGEIDAGYIHAGLDQRLDLLIRLTTWTDGGYYLGFIGKIHGQFLNL